MKAYSTLLDDCMPELPGVTIALVTYHIKRACIDFYQRSQYGREVLAAIDLTANLGTYTVAPIDAANFAVDQILAVKFSSGGCKPRELDPRTPEQLDTDLPGWDTQSGTPWYYTQRAPDQVTLAYAPAADYAAGLVVTITRVPLEAGGGIDDDVHARYRDGIAAGAKARLMRMSRKPWTDLNSAMSYQAHFDREIAAAGAMAARAFGRAPLRTRPCP